MEGVEPAKAAGWAGVAAAREEDGEFGLGSLPGVQEADAAIGNNPAEGERGWPGGVGLTAAVDAVMEEAEVEADTVGNYSDGHSEPSVAGEVCIGSGVAHWGL